MSEKSSEKSEKSSELSAMSSVNEASALVQRVAGPLEAGGIKAAIGRAARRLGFRYSRTKDIWYGDARRIDASEIDRLREEAARVEAEQAVSNVLALRDSLAATDPQRHREAIGALDIALGAMGAAVDPVELREE
jgi:hypothetical protein